MKIQSPIGLIAALVIGILLGIVTALVWNTEAIYATVDYEVNANDWLGFAGAVLGALATIVAAVVAYSLANRSSEAHKMRELIAARAILASDLSTVIDYLTVCSKLIADNIYDLVHQPSPPRPIEMPNLPMEVLLRLGMIVSLAHPKDAEAIANFLSDIQIQRARLSAQIEQYLGRGDSRIIQSPHSLHIALKSTIDLYIQAVSLFDYARRRSETVSPADYSAKNIGNALWELKIESLEDPEVLERTKKELEAIK